MHVIWICAAVSHDVFVIRMAWRAGILRDIVGGTWRVPVSDQAKGRSQLVKESITVEEVISFLNDLTIIDERAIYKLITIPTLCNDALAKHPTVQVRSESSAYRFSVLGVINGMFGVDSDGWGPIVAVFNDHGLVGFRATNEQDKKDRTSYET